ncbi:MAG: sodium:calcium antiporter [Eubacteriales bacterium]
MLALQIFLLAAGMLLLVKGADWFVDGSAGVARKCKISTLVIGLTVVAFGTSAPELAVSVTSAIGKSTEIAIGNVVGSNILNILLILGVSSLIRPLPVQRNSLRLDFPVLSRPPCSSCWGFGSIPCNGGTGSFFSPCSRLI